MKIETHYDLGDVLWGLLENKEFGWSVNGKPVTIKLDGGKVYINDAQVIITDILTSNGMIHVIEKVILPPQ